MSAQVDAQVIAADVAEFGADSAVFRAWAAIHRDYKGAFDGVRSVMVMDSRGVTVLAVWRGPAALAAVAP